MTKQIKVTQTKMHKIPKGFQTKPSGEKILLIGSNEIPVVEGKLILVKKEFGNLEESHVRVGKFDSKLLRPIIISETEKIEVSDLYLMFIDNKWEQMERCSDQQEADRCNNNSPIKDNCFKILALPEHFSPKHLQAIVDGKLKDGDKVLVECILCNEVGNRNEGEYVINTFPKNYITLHKIEEKMYTLETFIIELQRYNIHGTLNSHEIHQFRDWFKQNVK